MLLASSPHNASRWNANACGQQQYQQQQQQQQQRPHAMMTVMATDAYSSPSNAKSKRKRSSYGPMDDDNDDSVLATSPNNVRNGAWPMPIAMEDVDGADGNDAAITLGQSEKARGKRSRVAGLSVSPPNRHMQMPSSPSNVPFSSAFRAAKAAPRPPTVEEQQSWASSSTQPVASPPAGVFATASPQWVKIQTDYGHAFVREGDADVDQQHAAPPIPSAIMSPSSNCAYEHDMGDASMNEEAMMMTMQAPPTMPFGRGASAYTAPVRGPAASSSSLWRNIEGDVEGRGEPANSMDIEDGFAFDPDTDRRGDSFAWEEDILQLRVPSGTPHAHPYHMNAATSRAELGAAYFDQCAQQAARV